MHSVSSRIREADELLRQSWNEKMWADGGPVDPSPSIDQTINASYPWLEIQCSRCKTPRAVNLAAPASLSDDHLAGRFRCVKWSKTGKRRNGVGRAAATGEHFQTRRDQRDRIGVSRRFWRAARSCP
ncbi:hypothetical protein ABIF33_004868 [Bradyrhizobium elkanii]|uniref:hypothetical protein n=1 Tax=Bradyrhizobium elkanii TaxID=29448 RepID=UPI0035188DBC